MFWKAALNYSFVDVTNQTILKKYNPRYIQTSDSMPSDELLFSWFSVREPNCVIHWIEIYPVERVIHFWTTAASLRIC